MLLTKLIPPQSHELKNAVSDFNRFIEEPNSDPTERLILTLAGGRACCKSTIASGLVLKGCDETGCSGVCIRKHGHSVRTSVVAQLKWTSTKLESDYKLNLLFPCPTFVRCKEKVFDSSVLPIYCFGAEQRVWLSNMTSISNVKVVWIDEANEFESIADLRSTIYGLPLADNPVIILTFNPPASRDHWINDQVWGGESRLINGINHVMRFYHPTYLDVPREWLGEQLFKVAENLRNLNEEAYRNAYLGWPNGSPTH